MSCQPASTSGFPPVVSEDCRKTGRRSAARSGRTSSGSYTGVGRVNTRASSVSRQPKDSANPTVTNRSGKPCVLRYTSSASRIAGIVNACSWRAAIATRIKNG
ncbi:hypothetical protein [Parascardovia denticolens]|uniref:hypothetical protein n=1 Tax=Parascardovia denticolens TaxID=78258 RepID=UPI0012FE4D2D|nr:hypothetical protein [Parascardovia denticolens]